MPERHCEDRWDWIPPISELDDGCKYVDRLFLSVDFMKKEKIPYYDENNQVFFKQTIQERKEIRELTRPDLYDRKTINQELLCFM